METKTKKDKNKASDLTEIHKFDIKIEHPYRGIEVSIICEDANDAMILSGRTIETMRYVMKCEPKSLVMP